MFTYIQDEDNGVGILTVDGEIIRNLVSVEIKARTNTDVKTTPTLKYEQLVPIVKDYEIVGCETIEKTIVGGQEK